MEAVQGSEGRGVAVVGGERQNDYPGITSPGNLGSDAALGLFGFVSQ